MQRNVCLPLLAGAWLALAPASAAGQDAAAKPDDLGEKVFQANCAVCHGETGKGDGTMAAGLNPAPADLTDKEWLFGGDPESVKKTISTGVPKTAMPPWGSALKPEEIAAVAAYVIAFSAGASPAPAASSPAANGQPGQSQ
jgi:cbb3-type cytochrome c oxidase subunit III